MIYILIFFWFTKKYESLNNNNQKIYLYYENILIFPCNVLLNQPMTDFNRFDENVLIRFNVFQYSRVMVTVSKILWDTLAAPVNRSLFQIFRRFFLRKVWLQIIVPYVSESKKLPVLRRNFVLGAFMTSWRRHRKLFLLWAQSKVMETFA